MAYQPIPATAVIGGRKPRQVRTRRTPARSFATDPLSFLVRQYMSQYQSPAQIEATARRLADESYQHSLAAARQSTLGIQQQAKRQEDWIAGLQGVMRGFGERDAAMIRDEYGRAGTEMGDFASALSYGLVAPSEQAQI